MNFAQLKKKAQELGIKFDEDVTEEELSNLVQQALDSTNDGDGDDDDDGKDDNKDEEYWQKEAKAAFNARDDEKKKRRTLEKQLNDLKKKLDDAPSKDQLSDLEEKLKTLSEFREQVEAEREEKELKNKTDLERTQIQHKKEVDSLTKKFENELDKFRGLMGETQETVKKKDEQISALRQKRLDAEILEYASKFKAINPRQIARMLRSEFSYNEELDEFENITYDRKGKIESDMTVEEKIKDFLSKEENENLVEASVNTSGLKTDTTQKDVINPKKVTQKKTVDGYNPNDSDLVAEASEEGFSDVNDYIEVLQMRDAKLGKTKES